MSTGRPSSKRQELRAQRRRRQQRQRLITTSLIFLVAFVVLALLIGPTVRDALAPVGEFAMITPSPRPMTEGTAMGDPDAPVRIDVFSDFQCSQCVLFAQTVEPQLVDTYVANGQAYLVFRHFPFIDDGVMTNESDQAANASMCAAEQDRFWDYHDMLTENFGGANLGIFRDRRLIAFAEALNLDMDQFNACFRENRYRDEIQADRNDGEGLQVTGTPSVFVNGQQIAPGFVPQFDQLQEAIEEVLASRQ